ncbi:MAG: hypothetical protein AB7S50_11555 [Bacteroidales bacterium]
MEKELCPKVRTCPLFNGTLLKVPGAEDSYKNLFCKAGKQQWATCKRYMTSEKVGKCSDWILPNCSMSLDQIVQKMKEKGELPA